MIHSLWPIALCRSLWKKYLWRLDFIDEFTSNLPDARKTDRLLDELTEECTDSNANKAAAGRAGCLDLVAKALCIHAQHSGVARTACQWLHSMCDGHGD